MSDIFQELEKMGFSNIEPDSLFKTQGAKDKKSTDDKKIEPEKIPEESFLFEKKYECPICDNHFTSLTVRVGRARHVSTDIDLHPRYTGVDPLKYDVVVCPSCGYAALTKSFVLGITSLQRRLLKEKVQANFKGLEGKKTKYTYEDALIRYKMALYSSIVKMAKNSERAYLCLKIAWIYRSSKEEQEAAGNKQKALELAQEERDYIERAYEGFESAVRQEMFPICGMDETTFDYLFSVLALKSGHKDVAKKLVGKILVSRTTPRAVKERARKLKEELMEKDDE